MTYACTNGSNILPKSTLRLLKWIRSPRSSVVKPWPADLVVLSLIPTADRNLIKQKWGSTGHTPS